MLRLLFPLCTLLLALNQAGAQDGATTPQESSSNSSSGASVFNDSTGLVFTVMLEQLAELQASVLSGNVLLAEEFCLNYGTMNLLDNIYYTSKQANPILAQMFGTGIGQLLDLTIGRLGPLTRVFLDESCSPFTARYNESLVAYMDAGAFGEDTMLANLVQPMAGPLDRYYAAAARDLARTEEPVMGPASDLAIQFLSNAESQPEGRSSNSAGSGSEGGAGMLQSILERGFGGGSSGTESASSAASDLGRSVVERWGVPSASSEEGSPIGSWFESLINISSGEELESLQQSLAQSPILIRFAKALGDLNAQALYVLKEVRSEAPGSA